MNETQPRGSKQGRGWPPKKQKAGKSGEVFSLDFLFIEQAHAAEFGCLPCRQRYGCKYSFLLRKPLVDSKGVTNDLLQRPPSELICALFSQPRSLLSMSYLHSANFRSRIINSPCVNP